MESDLEFAQRCARGERQAWDEFLVKYSRLIYTYVFSAARSHGVSLSPSEKDDIFQEILVSLIDDDFRKLKSFRGLNGCSLASWLRQVTINMTLNHIGRKQEGVSLEDDSSGLMLRERLPTSPVTVSDLFEVKENHRRLSECIERLELDDKYFLELNLWLGLSLEEIKDHLKISRGAVDMRKQRIVARLRECFKGKAGPSDGT